MRRSILMLLLISAALIFFGCEKNLMEDAYTDSELAEQEMAALKGAKAKWTFTGTCMPAPKDPIDVGVTTPDPPSVDGTTVIGYIAEWYDKIDDYRLNGPSIWYADYYWEGLPFQSNCYAEGKTEILVENPYHPDGAPIGKWEMTWQGNLYFSMTETGPRLAGSVDGKGKGIEGVVKNMEAEWLYSIDWDFTGAPTYMVEGKITKGKGKHHGKPGKHHGHGHR